MFVLCLVLASPKEQVDKLNLVELENQFFIENEQYFYIFGKFTIRDSPESLSKMQLWVPKHHTKGVDQWKLRRVDIYTFIYV